MNTRTEPARLLPEIDHGHLDALEEESLFILREVAASFERPALLVDHDHSLDVPQGPAAMAAP